MCFHFFIYSKYILNEPENLEEGIGDPDWRLTISLFVAWVIIFLIVIRGVWSIGKVAYFLAIFPYAVMVVLLIYGATLPGAARGMEYFFTANWDKLLEAEVREWMIL